MNGTFVGFGFGAIQSGLLLYEAFQSKNFSRLVVAEVVPEVVAAVREAGGYSLNIATAEGIEPADFAQGAAAALRFAYPEAAPNETGDALRKLWKDAPKSEANAVVARIEQACRVLDNEEGGAPCQAACG